jgi:hypothetical protein
VKILKILIIIEIIVQTTYALDPMYDYRYTLAPEIVVPDAFHVGFGGYTYFNEDFRGIVNAQLGLNDYIEVGMKASGGTKDDWLITRTKERYRYWVVVDIGAKYALSQNLSLQADVPIALNDSARWGGVISLSQWSGYTKNISFLLEGRVGLGGVAGYDRYVKPAVAFFPYFQVGDAIRFTVGTISSFSVGNYDYFKDDFMVDILPRIEVGLVWFRLIGEVSIGILPYDNDKNKRFAFFIVKDM